MKEFVARENIKRFEAQLAACTDPRNERSVTVVGRGATAIEGCSR